MLALVAYRNGARFSASGAAQARFPIQGRSGYEYGNELQISLVGLWKWRPTFVPALEFRGRVAGGDRFVGRETRNTGGTRWMSGLRLLKEFPALRLGLEAAFLLPLYHDMNGLQLGVDRQLGFNLSWQVR